MARPEAVSRRTSYLVRDIPMTFLGASRSKGLGPVPGCFLPFVGRPGRAIQNFIATESAVVCWGEDA